MLTGERQLQALTLELQQPIATSSLLCFAEESMGGDNFPEPLLSIRISGVEVGIVRLDGLAVLIVIIGARTKQLPEIPAKESRQPAPVRIDVMLISET